MFDVEIAAILRRCTHWVASSSYGGGLVEELRLEHPGAPSLRIEPWWNADERRGAVLEWLALAHPTELHRAEAAGRLVDVA